jgi:hypothetical protein
VKIKSHFRVRFQVLTAASMKMIALYDIGTCSLEADRRFRGARCLHHQHIFRVRFHVLTTASMKIISLL